MKIEYFRYLTIVADCQSISKAAVQLHLKQQYLSHVIKSIESNFGIQIFERHSRGITLTDDGKYFLAQARQILHTIDHMHLDYLYPSKATSRYDTSEIHYYTVPHITSDNIVISMKKFHQHFPNVNISVIEKSQSEIIESVLNDPFAVGLVGINESLESFQKKLPDTLQVKFCSTTELFALAGNQNSHAQHQQSISLNELLKKELIIHAPQGLESSLAHRVLSQYGEPEIRYVVENSNLFINLLKNNNYYSIGSKTLSNHQHILAIPLQENIQLSTALIFHEDALTSFIIKNFINIFLLHFNQPTI